MSDLSGARADAGRPVLRPVLVACHGGDFAPSVARAVALRPPGARDVIELEDGWSADDFVPVLGRYPGSVPVHIVHLVGDLEVPGGARPGAVLGAIPDYYERLRSRFPTVDVRSWVVVRCGPMLSAEEQHLLARCRMLVRSTTFAAALAVTDASSAALAHEAMDVDRQVGDLLHAIGSTNLWQTVTGSDVRTFAVGIGSVVLRPDGLVQAAIRSVGAELERVGRPRPSDPGYGTGRRWADELGLAPAGLEATAADAVAERLLKGPAGSNLAQFASASVRRLDLELEAVDPGLWPGYIATAIDAATAPHTDPRAAPSPVAQALAQIEANRSLFDADLLADLESQARTHLLDQGNAPSVEQWCDGAQARLQEAVEEWGRIPDDDPIDLTDAYRRLSKASRRLPYSSSTLARALLLVVSMLVIGYTFAPIGSLVAWALSKRVLFFGGSLEENARAWARVTAIGSGVACWCWWEMKWRRVRRLRARYVGLAEEQLRRMVEHRALLARIGLIRSLIDRIGKGAGVEGTLRWWLAQGAAAVEEVRRVASEEGQASGELLVGPWSVVLPSASEPVRLLDELSEEAGRNLRVVALTTFAKAGLVDSHEAIEASILEGFRANLPVAADDLDSQWRSEEAISAEARGALEAELTPGLPEVVANRKGVERRRHLAATPHVSSLLRRGSAGFDSDIATFDPCFAATLWITTLVLPEPPAPTEGEP